MWFKALLGITMFEGTMAAVSNAQRGAELAKKVAAGEADMSVMADIIRAERMGAYTILTLCIINVVLAVWRPRLKWKVAEAPRSASAKD